MDEERKQRIRESLLRYNASLPEGSRGGADKQRGRERPELAKVLTGRRLSEDHKRRISESNRGRVLGSHVNAGEKLRQFYEDHPEARQSISDKLKGHVVTDESKRRNSETNAANWQCKEFVRRQLALRKQSPNGCEQWLLDTLESLFPGVWRFNGAGPLVVAGHVPDFEDTLGRRWLIEAFGSFWHSQVYFPKRLTAVQLVELYRVNSYDCLVFEEFDLMSEALVRRAVMEHFHGMPIGGGG